MGGSTSSRGLTSRVWSCPRILTASRRFFPAALKGPRLYGRGSCDAKGILAAQVAAAERARAGGRTRCGAVSSSQEKNVAPMARRPRTPGRRHPSFLINGEPTDNRLGIATKGVYRARLTATGRAAHSSQPELGESAIDKLIDALVAVRRVAWPDDPLFGATNYSVGLISGGVAPNVIAPLASAELMFRTVGDYLDVRDNAGRRSRAAWRRWKTCWWFRLCGCIRFAGFDSPCFRSRPTYRFWTAGARRCCGPGFDHRGAHRRGERGHGRALRRHGVLPDADRASVGIRG